MKTRIFPAMLVASLLAGCGGNPFVTQTGEDDGEADTATGSVYGDDISSDLTMDSMVYDASADELVVNNIPFDGATASNGQAVYARTGSLPGSFGRYENVAGADRYYAVFRRSASGGVEAGAVGTASYVSYGYGGVAAKRLTPSITLPGSGEYTFTGQYAAVRVFDSASGIDAPQYVTGSAAIDIDFGDFDGVGAIIGRVTGRQVFDSNGAPMGVMNDYIALALGDVDLTDATIDGGGATSYDLTTRTPLASGDWAGVLGGPNGQELAGIVVLEGTVDDAGGTGNMRESGVIIAVR